MKKLVIALCFAILVVLIMQSSTFKGRISKKSLYPPSWSGMTLNGVPTYTADDMVGAFVDDNTSSDARTDIWLSKSWVDNVAQILKDEGDDGFRIYFAKRTDNFRNSAVIVATKKNGSDHEDFYDHTLPSSSFLNTADAKFVEDYAGDPNATYLYYNADCSEDNCPMNAVDYMSCSDANAAVKNFMDFDYGQGINTKSEWFPKEVLINIADELKAALNQTPKIDADGIRIYFAKNLQTANQPEHINRHCFIIVTTKKIQITPQTSIHRDYYKCYKPQVDSLTNNNGEECPNNCNGVKLPQS